MNDRKKPEIRFKEFHDDWEQRKFDDFVTFYSGLTYAPNDVQDSGTLVLRSSNVKDGEVISADDVYVNPSKATSENVKSGDLIVVVRNGSRALIGKHAQIKRSMPNTVIGAFMTGIRSDHSEFVNALLDTPQFKKEVDMNMGATINQITGYMFSQMEFMVPSEVEQDKLGGFFKDLDNCITLHQRELDKLKIIKKSMLENCFPKNDESTPKFRFSGFTDDWEQRKFDEVFMSLQNNTLSRAKLNDEAGAAQNIHYGDVLIKYDEVLDVSNEPLSYIEKQTIADKFKTSYLQNGDVIIADTAEDETVGKCTEIAGLTDQKVISGLHTMPVRPNRKFAPGFLGFYLNSAAYHDQLKPLMQGIKVTSISKGAVQDTVITFPSDLKEQKEIGAYFESLDRLITLHQRKLEKLNMLKKSLLKSMFA